MVVILVKVLTVTRVKYIRPSAAAAAAATVIVAVMKRQSSTQNLTEAGRGHARPLLKGQIQILS
jgi:hypothetical protein